MNGFINNKIEILYLYIILINLVTLLSFIVDKSKAKREKWRIPEGRLLFLSLIGGALGGLIGMAAVKHKTKSLKFTLGIPLLLLVNIIIWYLIKKMA